MAEPPRSPPEVEARFPDEAACACRLLARRWPNGFRRPACGRDEAWELGRERRTSVTAGAVLRGAATRRCGRGSWRRG